MARKESDREDLFQEMTALVERLAIGGTAYPEVWVIGFRRDGAVSIYMGADPAYHFTTAGALRRAYVQGNLFKAEQGQLIEMVRNRTEAAVELRSQPLSATATSDFLDRLSRAVSNLLVAWDQGDLAISNPLPAGTDVAAKVRKWLTELPRPIAVAQSPGGE